MSSVGFVAPVKEGAAARAFAAELKGERRAEYVSAQKRQGCTRERIFLTETPMGPMIVGYRDAHNAGFHMATLASSSSAFDKWYIESISRIAGRDLATMPAGAPPHLAFEWTNGQRSRSCTMIAAPVPDPSKFWQMCRDMSMRSGDHKESRERQGIVFEQAFYLHEMKMVAVYLEGTDVDGAMERSMSSTASYDKWFIEQASAVHGIDFKAHAPPKPELLVLFDA